MQDLYAYSGRSSTHSSSNPAASLHWHHHVCPALSSVYLILPMDCCANLIAHLVCIQAGPLARSPHYHQVQLCVLIVVVCVLSFICIQVKVCDFNLSRMVAQQQQLTNSGNPNSPGWQSPEMLSGQPYGKPADVFSFGVVLWETLTLKEPWG
eukprot:GHUV01042898.1.p1 GENE.GHUV01042898.1~~GHUV01042898.1.p1  ORF type:complete len:152 (-),score=19.92 GHUV01042898.1:378-833(-)